MISAYFLVFSALFGLVGNGLLVHNWLQGGGMTPPETPAAWWDGECLNNTTLGHFFVFGTSAVFVGMTGFTHLVPEIFRLLSVMYSFFGVVHYWTMPWPCGAHIEKHLPWFMVMLTLQTRMLVAAGLCLMVVDRKDVEIVLDSDNATDVPTKVSTDDNIQANTTDDNIQNTTDDNIQNTTTDDNIQNTTTDDSIQNTTTDDNTPANTTDDNIQNTTTNDNIQNTTDDNIPANTTDDNTPANTTDDNIQNTTDDNIQNTTTDDNIQNTTTDDNTPANTTDDNIQNTTTNDNIQNTTTDDNIPANTTDADGSSVTQKRFTAAVKIQSVMRGFGVRSALRSKHRETFAGYQTVKFQNIVRSYVRKNIEAGKQNLLPLNDPPQPPQFWFPLPGGYELQKEDTISLPPTKNKEIEMTTFLGTNKTVTQPH
jgi:hypothetical protein